ncbi:inward rectifier potassium channel 16-like [Stegostoma tigrinum]|uniref:inward rectifier potassium channel 16-like n=1 Tax=Stegostoma tigrinum TaxID=3053191 RepID=UPI00202AE157|nr:inward rectifier potassium channel 16-like [Stegostoma tigrinum]XP_048411453.1 inward rectifier potassium channel 16-like [Stegostoma tigrinum]XP_048411454.1 inward rectifier potassium channel 16-like [Stegostoma tigrinum]XP_048411458.1 inward rectifier potassium channel 16-like [Stegostoma tigrinum]XP_048411459.1 inward rectifier potassium channel 16-like [Stegostoma tigrinum]XP_048411460.1 inward rectifier potassium channel 16-like [Stegostoma tigrinum]XP_059509657.1 inward rectifier pot
MNFINLNYQTVSSEDDHRNFLKNGCYIPVNKRRYRKRFLRKDGNCNIHFKRAFGEWESYFSDIFTTLIDLKWRQMFLIFSLSYILSWLFFGFVYWITAVVHGDLQIEEENLVPCIVEVHSFTAAFLFSIETQTTIGYGSRCVTEECPFAVSMVTFQSVISCLINTFIIGVVVAKMSKARKRAQTIRFSNNAVIAVRNGKLCMMWRIGDFRESHIIEGTVRAQLLQFKEYDDNKLSVEHQDLQIVTGNIILISPVTIVHEINENSPLYDLNKKDLAESDFEIIVTFVYSEDSTGNTHQSRSSYTPLEILWGHHFNEVLKNKPSYYKVNYSQFHKTEEVTTPECSAKTLYSTPEHSINVLTVAGLDSEDGKCESMAIPNNKGEHDEEQYVYPKPEFTFRSLSMESEL